MLSYLKSHPFQVSTFLETSLVLTYAVPIDDAITLIPECLELDTFDNNWAFIAVAMVQTKDLRPKGFPKFLGNDFILIGYRIFVRYNTSSDKRLRGLYILGSETDKWKMAMMGNIFTHYNYQPTDIDFKNDGSQINIQSLKSGLDIKVNYNIEDISLPVNSPFKDWKEARRFAGPLPFTFSYNPKKSEVLLIEGVRENWTPSPVQIIKEEVGFVKNLGFKEIYLANGFVIHNIPYYWKKGRTDIWKK